MPKKQQWTPTPLDLSHLSKTVKLLKGFQVATTSQSDLASQDPNNPIPDLEDVSEMTKKPKKTQEEAVEERIAKAIEKGIENAISAINRKLVVHILNERVRQAVNERFHGRISPADVDRFAMEGARAASYELGDLKILPASFHNNVMVDFSKKAKHNYTSEPDDEYDIHD